MTLEEDGRLPRESVLRRMNIYDNIMLVTDEGDFSCFLSEAWLRCAQSPEPSTCVRCVETPETRTCVSVNFKSHTMEGNHSQSLSFLVSNASRRSPGRGRLGV